MISPDERINIDLFLAEDEYRLEVLKALDFKNRQTFNEISRKIALLPEEVEIAVKDIEAVGLADTREELKLGKLTYVTRLSTRGLRYLKEIGYIEEEEKEEEGTEEETEGAAEEGESAEGTAEAAGEAKA